MLSEELENIILDYLGKKRERDTGIVKFIDLERSIVYMNVRSNLAYKYYRYTWTT